MGSRIAGEHGVVVRALGRGGIRESRVAPTVEPTSRPSLESVVVDGERRRGHPVEHGAAAVGWRPRGVRRVTAGSRRDDSRDGGGVVGSVEGAHDVRRGRPGRAVPCREGVGERARDAGDGAQRSRRAAVVARDAAGVMSGVQAQASVPRDGGRSRDDCLESARVSNRDRRRGELRRSRRCGDHHAEEERTSAGREYRGTRGLQGGLRRQAHHGRQIARWPGGGSVTTAASARCECTPLHRGDWSPRRRRHRRRRTPAAEVRRAAREVLSTMTGPPARGRRVPGHRLGLQAV